MSGPEVVRPRRAIGALPAPWLDVYPLTGRTGFRAVGEVSLPTHGVWERALEGAVRDEGDVYHVELSALSFVDVAGAEALADAARRFGERRLVLDRPPAALPRVLELLWPGLPAIEVAAS
ncbi:STAS domain-containing protein [Streptomyces sp. NPDC053069]|uniref:STAS domain-containing protein n=1 Tax=Streptomyces sp. NPDC053069 TaxID=3365695 RepID=UPI0037D31CC7